VGVPHRGALALHLSFVLVIVRRAVAGFATRFWRLRSLETIRGSRSALMRNAEDAIATVISASA
jgi:hypothetical protein